jgi:hypothetical protein
MYTGCFAFTRRTTFTRRAALTRNLKKKEKKAGEKQQFAAELPAVRFFQAKLSINHSARLYSDEEVRGQKKAGAKKKEKEKEKKKKKKIKSSPHLLFREELSGRHRARCILSRYRRVRRHNASILPEKQEKMTETRNLIIKVS